MIDGAFIDGCEAVFFDFDGVLVESIAIKVEAFRRLYDEFGPDVVARVLAHHKEHEGISRLEKIRHCHREFLGVTLSDDEVTAWGRRYAAMVEEGVVACDPVPGAVDLLQRHRGRRPLFVVSGTPEDELRRIVDKRGMAPYFTDVRGSPPRKTPIVRDLLAHHGLDPARCLFMGDAMADHRAAMDTGMPFLGRVAAGADNPFPPGTETISDLRRLLP
ncbi:MAG: HAD family phosphatase [Hyphomicrobiales bacterium]|nr:HAD family phosphatase [Hyphomicrobiales bacterium]MCP5372312.1 HAD family phosphatase [Hyphomicrobiales bacterium]